MKRLITLVTVIVTTACASAATINWQASKGYLYAAGTETKITTGDAYLMLVTSSYTQSDLVSAFVAAKGNAAATISAMTASGALATGTGTIGANARISGSSTYNFSSDITAYFVVFNSNNMYVSSEASGLYDSVSSSSDMSFAAMSTSSKAAALDATKGYTSAGWYAVPEPTSGLLILVGLAGLALRRRRA